MFQSSERLIKIKSHSRHYYLGLAAFYMHRNDMDRVDVNLQVVEKLQEDIEDLEKKIDL